MPDDKDNANTRDVTEDGSLERLFDYTKWHIGIYLAAGGGLVALLGSADKVGFLKSLVGSPKAMFFSLIAMLVAGISGGVVASGATQCSTFQALWDKPQGPFKLSFMLGRSWAWLEHTAFWTSLALFAFSILSAPAVLMWIFG